MVARARTRATDEWIDSINPSIHRSIDPSIHQSIDPSIHRSLQEIDPGTTQVSSVKVRLPLIVV
jgi:hypothetical protein